MQFGVLERKYGYNLGKKIRFVVAVVDFKC